MTKIKADKKLFSLQKTLCKHNEMHAKICKQATDIMKRFRAAVAVGADTLSYTNKEMDKILYWLQQYEWTIEMLAKYEATLYGHHMHVIKIVEAATQNITNIKETLKSMKEDK